MKSQNIAQDNLICSDFILTEDILGAIYLLYNHPTICYGQQTSLLFYWPPPTSLQSQHPIGPLPRNSLTLAINFLRSTDVTNKIKYILSLVFSDLAEL